MYHEFFCKNSSGVAIGCTFYNLCSKGENKPKAIILGNDHFDSANSTNNVWQQKIYGNLTFLENPSAILIVGGNYIQVKILSEIKSLCKEKMPVPQ